MAGDGSTEVLRGVGAPQSSDVGLMGHLPYPLQAHGFQSSGQHVGVDTIEVVAREEIKDMPEDGRPRRGRTGAASSNCGTERCHGDSGDSNHQCTSERTTQQTHGLLLPVGSNRPPGVTEAGVSCAVPARRGGLTAGKLLAWKRPRLVGEATDLDQRHSTDGENESR